MAKVFERPPSSKLPSARDAAGPDSRLSKKKSQYKQDLEEANKETSDDPRLKKPLTVRQLATVLKPFFWPKAGNPNYIANRVRCLATWVFVAISKSSNVASPLFLSNATNALVEGDKRGAMMGIMGYVFLGFFSKIAKEMQSFVYLKVKEQASIEISETSFIHIHKLSLQWHLKKKMGNVIRSMFRGTEAAGQLMNYMLLWLVPAIAECIATVVLFFIRFSEWRIAIITLFALFAYGGATVYITAWRKKFRTATNHFDNAFHDRATDSIINYETVKCFTNEDYEIDTFSTSVRKFAYFTKSTFASMYFLNITQHFLMYGTLLAALLLAVGDVLDGGSDIGDFVAINAYLIQLFQPLFFLGSVYNMIIQALVDIRNLSELLNESPDVVDVAGAKPISVPGRGGKGVPLAFEDIFFHYPGQNEDKGLQGVSFSVAAGTTTALVGHTGAGKSTISRLLFRFYDPLKGKVVINGQDISQLQQKSVRQNIGVVPQDTVLFNDTILHNVQYGRLDASMEEVRNACRAAQILDFIEGLKDGWETQVGERGLKLSGGEKQRVAIARCLLKDPPVVLLDEATSALDTKTEHGVQEALNNLRANRTTLVIAHRLSTVRQAAQILVLEAGKIIERGTHEELLEKKGVYHEMWEMQIVSDRIRQESEAAEAAEAAGRAIAVEEVAVEEVAGTEETKADEGGSQE
ncbi:unnamed protein product [Chrysoparadoxa australica]